MMRGILDAAIRKEMKGRVDQLLAAQKESNKKIDQLIEAIANFQQTPDMAGLVRASEEWAKAAETTKAASANLEATLTKVGIMLS